MKIFVVFSIVCLHLVHASSSIVAEPKVELEDRGEINGMHTHLEGRIPSKQLDVELTVYNNFHPFPNEIWAMIGNFLTLNENDYESLLLTAKGFFERLTGLTRSQGLGKRAALLYDDFLFYHLSPAFTYNPGKYYLKFLFQIWKSSDGMTKGILATPAGFTGFSKRFNYLLEHEHENVPKFVDFSKKPADNSSVMWLLTQCLVLRLRKSKSSSSDSSSSSSSSDDDDSSSSSSDDD